MISSLNHKIPSAYPYAHNATIFYVKAKTLILLKHQDSLILWNGNTQHSHSEAWVKSGVRHIDSKSVYGLPSSSLPSTDSVWQGFQTASEQNISIKMKQLVDALFHLDLFQLKHGWG